jgi:hypothetical protein
MYSNESTQILQPAGGELSCDRKTSLESKELLNRREAAEYASLIGTPVAVATYAKLASVGGGPEMILFGRRVFYRPTTIRSWITSKLRFRGSTSEAV